MRASELNEKTINTVSSALKKDIYKQNHFIFLEMKNVHRASYRNLNFFGVLWKQQPLHLVAIIYIATLL